MKRLASYTSQETGKMITFVEYHDADGTVQEHRVTTLDMDDGDTVDVRNFYPVKSDEPGECFDRAAEYYFSQVRAN